MAGVRHTFSTPIADDASAIAAGMVTPGHWNAEHTLSGVAEQSALDVVSAAVNVVSGVAANALSVGNAVSNRLSTWTLDDLANVSAPSPTSGQVIKFNSAAGQWVASADNTGGGGGSVTSAEVNAVSAAAASADGTLSVRIDSAAALNSNQASAIAANSAQMTSADNAISAAAAAISAAHTSLAASVAGALSAIIANSAQMTSADNAISNAVSIVSAAVVSTNNRISANSAQMTSADNAISNAVSIVSAAVVSVNNRISGVSADLTSVQARVSNISAQMTSADNAISQAVSVVSAAQAVTSAAVTSVNAVVSNRTSAIQANSAQMTSADNAISNAVSIVSVAAANAISGVNAVSQRLSALVLDSLFNVSAPSPTSGQVLKYNSAAAQWVASGDNTGAGGSVTSAEVNNVSVAAASADATLSVRLDSVVNRVSANSGVGGGGSVTSTELSAVSAAAASGNATLSARIDSVAAAGGGPTIRMVSNTQSTNASALVDISGLVLTVAADQTWEIQGALYLSTSVATVGFRGGISVPPLSLPRFMQFSRISGGQSAGILGGAGLMQVSGASQFFSAANMGGVLAAVDFKAIFNVASAGTFRMMYAGNASTAASPVHIMAGSYFKAVRLK